MNALESAGADQPGVLSESEWHWERPLSSPRMAAPGPLPSPSSVPSGHLQGGALDGEAWLSYSQVGPLPGRSFQLHNLWSTAVAEVKASEKAPRSPRRQVRDSALLRQGESRSEIVLCLLQLPLWDHFLQEAGLVCTLSPWATPRPAALPS